MLEEYLGDGVYATFDGRDMTLDLRAQPAPSGIARIVMEPSVYESLLRFRKYCEDYVPTAYDIILKGVCVDRHPIDESQSVSNAGTAETWQYWGWQVDHTTWNDRAVEQGACLDVIGEPRRIA